MTEGLAGCAPAGPAALDGGETTAKATNVESMHALNTDLTARLEVCNL